MTFYKILKITARYDKTNEDTDQLLQSASTILFFCLVNNATFTPTHIHTQTQIDTHTWKSDKPTAWETNG